MSLIKSMLLLFLIQITCQAQDSLYVDLDHDKIIDSVFYHRDDAVITCKLSSQKFIAIKSQEQEHIGSDPSGITHTKSGFEFYNDDMRCGSKAQFKYNKVEKKMQLIGLSNYNYGGASHDGAGDSSLNLLTNDLEGQWEYYNHNNYLKKTPLLKGKMYFAATFLEDYGEAIDEEYATKVSDFYEKRKKELLKKKRKK
jgi:hypothetical protein